MVPVQQLITSQPIFSAATESIPTRLFCLPRLSLSFWATEMSQQSCLFQQPSNPGARIPYCADATWRSSHVATSAESIPSEARDEVGHKAKWGSVVPHRCVPALCPADITQGNARDAEAATRCVCSAARLDSLIRQA